jgi:hypothetical protein
VGDPEAGEDAATVARPHVRPHGLRDWVRVEMAPGSPRGGVPAQHGRTDGGGSFGIAQAAAELAARVIGSPMTVFAGPWSQP